MSGMVTVGPSPFRDAMNLPTIESRMISDRALLSRRRVSLHPQIGANTMRRSGVICLLIYAIAPAMAQSIVGDTFAGISGTFAGIIGMAIVLACIALYFLPAIIGGSRHIDASGALFLVNLLFGWTVLGWFLCLIWAGSGATRAQDAFFERATSQPGTDPAAGTACREAYAKERARLDHEAEQKARGKST